MAASKWIEHVIRSINSCDKSKNGYLKLNGQDSVKIGQPGQLLLLCLFSQLINRVAVAHFCLFPFLQLLESDWTILLFIYISLHFIVPLLSFSIQVLQFTLNSFILHCYCYIHPLLLFLLLFKLLLHSFVLISLLISSKSSPNSFVDWALEIINKAYFELILV